MNRSQVHPLVLQNPWVTIQEAAKQFNKKSDERWQSIAGRFAEFFSRRHPKEDLEVFEAWERKKENLRPLVDLDQGKELITQLRKFIEIFPEVASPALRALGEFEEYLNQNRQRIYESHLQEFEEVCEQLNPFISLEKANAIFHTIVSPKVKKWICKINRQRAHLYKWRGAHQIGEKKKKTNTLFRLYAPSARDVSLVLTFRKHVLRSLEMRQNKFGVWETSAEVPLGQTYRYSIVQSHGKSSSRTDPFSFSTKPRGQNIESVVADPCHYQWQDSRWMSERACKNPLTEPFTGYELHIDLWKKKNGESLSFKKLAYDLVAYCKGMKFTHVELYGLLDHRNGSPFGGYQVDNFFAPNRRLGGVNDLQCLIDQLHQAGVGIILDWIPHYKQDHSGDYSQSLHCIDGEDHYSREPSSWGTSHFSFHKEEAWRFMLASLLYWLEELHIDGIRIDALSHVVRKEHGRGHTDEDAVRFFRDFNETVHRRFPGVLMIAEETNGFPGVVKRSRLGFDMKVAIGLQNKACTYFSTPYHQRKDHHNLLLEQLKAPYGSERWIMVHSHDDASSQQKGVLYNYPTEESSSEQASKDGYRSAEERKFANMRLFLAWNLLTPNGAHMIHMGDEIGQKTAWDRRGGAPEGAVEWKLLREDHPNSHLHQSLQHYVSELNGFYCEKNPFWQQGELGYQLIFENRDTSVIAYHRRSENQSLIVIHNFSSIAYNEYIIRLPSCGVDPLIARISGVNEIFNSDEEIYGGTGKYLNQGAIKIIRDDVVGRNWPQAIRVKLPALSTIVLDETLKTSPVSFVSEPVSLAREMDSAPASSSSSSFSSR